MLQLNDMSNDVCCIVSARKSFVTIDKLNNQTKTANKLICIVTH